MLKIKKLAVEDNSLIAVKNTDDLIDLSPCIGIYQEAVFFDHYQIDADIKLLISLNTKLEGLYTEEVKNSSLDQKILFLVSLETRQRRYRVQVITPFINKEQSDMIKARLKTRLNQDENAQVECSIDFYNRKSGKLVFSAKGFADVVKDNIVYELKFVSELMHEHFLQCASYMVAMDLPRGICLPNRQPPHQSTLLHPSSLFPYQSLQTCPRTSPLYSLPANRVCNSSPSLPW